MLDPESTDNPAQVEEISTEGSVRKLLSSLDSDPAEDAAAFNDNLEVESAAALRKMRFTDGIGTAPRDSQCVIPFAAQAKAFNGCNIEGPAPDDSEVGPAGWCPVKPKGDNTGRSYGILVVDKSTAWGQCQPQGYKPAKCVVTPW